MQRIAVVSVCLLVVSTAFAAPIISAYHTDSPPTLDARLDDACWAEANVTSPFLQPGGTLLPDEQTRARVCWDDQNLYIAVEAFDAYLEPRLNMLHAVKAEHSGEDARVFSDDCVEIFLQPGVDEYYHVAANSGDGRYDARATNSEWDSGWSCESRRLRDRYVLEMAIPFASLNGSPEGEWRVNFARERTAVEELSSWSAVEGGFHEPGVFGALGFEQSGPALTAVDMGRADSKYLMNATIGGDADENTQLAADLSSGNTTVDSQATGVGEHTLRMQIPPEAFETGQMSLKYAVRQGEKTIVSSEEIPERLAAAVVQLQLNTSDAEADVFLNGKPVEAAETMSLSLNSGLNHLAIAARATGQQPHIDPVVSAQGRAVPCTWVVQADVEGTGWHTKVPDFRWDRPRPVKSGVWAREGNRAAFVSAVYVGDADPQLFPKLNTTWLPRKSSQLIRFYLHMPQDVSSEGYTMVMEVPSFAQYEAIEPLSGGNPTVELVEEFEAERTPMSRYHISYDMLPRTGVELSMRWGDEEGNLVAYEPVLRSGGTHDWRHLKTEVTAPEAATSAHPLIIKWQNRGITGTFWVDNVVLRKKGSNENLLEMGTFDEAAWGNYSRLAEEGVNGSMACKIVSTPENADHQQACWVDKDQETPVEPGKEYIVEADVKCDSVGAPDTRPVLGLLFSAPADAPEGSFPVYTYFQSMRGRITEIPRRSTMTVTPPLADKRPEHARIAPCYYGSSLPNPKVGKAYADNCWASGITWTYGRETNNVASELIPRGLNVFWSIGWHPYHTVGDATEFLEEHPEYAAVDFDGEAVRNTFCPTWFLENEDNIGMQELESWLVESLNNSQYYGANWDLEHPVIDPPTFCTCDRCLAAFREFADLPEDTELTPDILLEEYPKEWTDFRCHQNAEMAGHLQEMVHKADRPIEFSIYSGFESKRTKEHYGVDWELMAPNIDFGIAGYGGNYEVITATREALGDTPFMGGEMWYLRHDQDPRPAPNMHTWCNRLLRQYVTSGCNGCLIWWLASMDGGAFYATSQATAVIAEYEDYFIHEQRCDERVTVEELNTFDWAAFEKDGEILVLLLNFSEETKTVGVSIEGTTHQVEIEPYGNEVLITDVR